MTPERERIEEYAGGEISVRRGVVNRWLLVLYAGLAVWGAWYLLAHWRG
jgi:hypothetical protein